MQVEDPEISRIVKDTHLWEFLITLASLLLVGVLTLVVARRLARWLSGKTRFGLRGLHRLAAPMTALVIGLVALLAINLTVREPPIIGELLVELVTAIAAFWVGARGIDVIWATISASARLRTRRRIASLLLVLRHLGKLLLTFTAVSVLAVQLGAGQQLYVILAALAAGFAFAARDPIRNAVAFAAMALDPPFQVGDRVRVSDYRSGESSVGTVTDISLSAVTMLTRQQTHIVIANIMLQQLRIENLSAADRRRLQFELPAGGLGTEALRETCDAIESDLREHPGVAPEPVPRVWLAGTGDGLQVKASLWLRRGADRREVQRDVLVGMSARLEGGHA